MIEEREKGELVHDFLAGTPHVFAMLEGNDMCCAMEGSGGDLLILWARFTMDLMEKIGEDDLEDMLRLSALAMMMRTDSENVEEEEL